MAKAKDKARFVFKFTQAYKEGLVYGSNVSLIVDGQKMASYKGGNQDLQGIAFEMYCKKRFPSKVDDIPQGVHGFDGVNAFYKKQTGKELKISFTKSSKSGGMIIGMDEA